MRAIRSTDHLCLLMLLLNSWWWWSVVLPQFNGRKRGIYRVRWRSYGGQYRFIDKIECKWRSIMQNRLCFVLMNKKSLEKWKIRGSQQYLVRDFSWAVFSTTTIATSGSVESWNEETTTLQLKESKGLSLNDGSGNWMQSSLLNFDHDSSIRWRRWSMRHETTEYTYSEV